MLSKETFTDSQVANFVNTNYIAVKIDAEKEDGPAIREKYAVTGYPTVVFIGADGAEVDRIIGFLPAGDYLATAQDYRANKNTLAFFQQELAAHPDSLDLLFKVGEKLTDRGKTDEAKVHLDKLVKLDKANASGHVDNALFMTGERLVRTEAYAKGVTMLRDMIKRYPDSDVLDGAYFMIIRAYTKQEKWDDASKTYREALQKMPTDADMHNAFAWFLAEHDLHLDEALTVGLKAVELDSTNAGILDTLAEVYNKRKEYDQAIATINRSIALKPDDPYFKDQLKKFTTAKNGGVADTTSHS